MPSGSQAASSYASTARTLNSTCIGAKNAVLRHVCTIDCDAVDVDRLADQVDMCSMRTLLAGLAGLPDEQSSRNAHDAVHPPRRPALARDIALDIQQLGNAVRTVLRTPSFTRASDRSRRAAGINGALRCPAPLLTLPARRGVWPGQRAW